MSRHASDHDRQSPELDGQSLDRALSSDDPTVGLRAVVALRTLADQLEALHIERARERGWSWQDVASVLGVSKQAVHKKYGDRGRGTARRGTQR